MVVAPPTAETAEFELEGWHVQPSRNRLRRGDTSVRIEPKMMDVLVTLAARPGQVVSKQELADAVWPNLFVTESVITRAIAGLRRALADDVRAPRFIETIAKRGYRLVAAPVAMRAPAAPAPSARPAAGQEAGAPAASPYAAGQWVRGERFYGREALLAELLSGPRNGVWLLGSRASGKTSTLKQLALLAAADAARSYLPLFWDLQGCERAADFDAGWREALAEAEDLLAAADLPLADVEAPDFLASLARLRRAARARGRTLLLLLDEAEALLALQAHSPATLRRLRSTLQAQEGVRTVLAASSRLWRLAAADDDTSPFLHGFAPPVYLGPLDDAAARRLVCGDGQPSAGPRIDARAVEEIVRRSAGHPYLLQLLCTRCCELGDLEAATEAVRADAGLHHLFATDFALLARGEQELLTRLAAAPPARLAVADFAGARDDVAKSLLHLRRLGVVRAEGDTVEIASPVLADWLRRHGEGPS